MQCLAENYYSSYINTYIRYNGPNSHNCTVVAEIYIKFIITIGSKWKEAFQLLEHSCKIIASQHQSKYKVCDCCAIELIQHIYALSPNRLGSSCPTIALKIGSCFDLLRIMSSFYVLLVIWIICRIFWGIRLSNTIDASAHSRSTISFD